MKFFVLLVCFNCVFAQGGLKFDYIDLCNNYYQNFINENFHR